MTMSLVISSLLIFSSCVPEKSNNEAASELDFTPNESPDKSDPYEPPQVGGDQQEEQGVESVKDVGILNFNQINMNFSKITGISRGEEEIQDVMGQIVNQLPSSNDIESFTAFTQISITRLAFSYCDRFVDDDPDFSSVNYATSSNNQLINLILRKTLDTNDSSNPAATFDQLAAELNDVLNNDPKDGSLTFIDETMGTSTERKKRLTKMACTLTLSSSYVTML